LIAYRDQIEVEQERLLHVLRWWQLAERHGDVHGTTEKEPVAEGLPLLLCDDVVRVADVLLMKVPDLYIIF
jgi:hypothetical protein